MNYFNFNKIIKPNLRKLYNLIKYNIHLTTMYADQNTHEYDTNSFVIIEIRF